jgi:UDP-GlcNAc:undecaprenyl-phosphate GlcNAc-1-phosphate transferase
MYSLLFLTLCSFMLSLVLTPCARRLYTRFGLMDQPSARKLHARPIPAAGGVAILLAYAIAMGLYALLSPHAVNTLRPSLLLNLLPAIGLVFVTGLLDDIFGLKPWAKLLGQLGAAVLAYMAGVHFSGIGGHAKLPWFNLIATLVWLVACSNAFNLIDGVDGLATGVGLFATLTIFLEGLVHHQTAMALAAAPLAGALLGFLRYNFNPASVFLGDSGSLLIGFTLGCFGVIWSEKSATLLGMTAPFMALAVPLLDTALAIVRRFLRHQPIFGADRNHIHHRLLDRGFSPRRVALVLYAVCGIAAALSLLQTVLQNQYGGLIIVVFCASSWIGIQHLGYAEFETARDLIFQRAFRRILDAQVSLRAFETQLSAAGSNEECWSLIRETARKAGFVSVSMQLHGRVYEEMIKEVDPALCWSIRVPLNGFDYVNFSHEFKHSVNTSVFATPLADVLRRILAARMPEEGQQDRVLSPAKAFAAGH